MSTGCCWWLCVLSFGLACQAGVLSSTGHPLDSRKEATEESPALAVWWSDDIELRTLAEAGATLAVLDPSRFSFLTKGVEVVQPQNCNEWHRLHESGYEPRTTLDAQPDGWARVHCETIALLRQARPATTSELRALSLAEPGILSVLPAVLATAVSNEQNEARTAAEVERLALEKLDPNAQIVGVEGAVMTISEDLEFSLIRVQIVARGDFNADGTDDVVLSVLNAVTRGTWSTRRVIVLTRDQAGEVLRQIHPMIFQNVAEPVP